MKLRLFPKVENFADKLQISFLKREIRDKQGIQKGMDIKGIEKR